MHRIGRPAVAALGCLLITVALGVPAFAQASFNTSYQTTDFSGEWTAVGGEVPFAGRVPHEIGYTAELYDYSGLPFNAAGRMRADTGDISDWSVPDFVCRPHPGVYNWYYGGGPQLCSPRGSSSMYFAKVNRVVRISLVLNGWVDGMN